MDNPAYEETLRFSSETPGIPRTAIDKHHIKCSNKTEAGRLVPDSCNAQSSNPCDWGQGRYSFLFHMELLKNGYASLLSTESSHAHYRTTQYSPFMTLTKLTLCTFKSQRAELRKIKL